MTSHRSFKIGMISLILAALLAIGFALAARAGWIDVSESSATTRLIQAQGSSPYCLFAVNGYLVGVDMWKLESDYHRLNLSKDISNSTIFPMLNKKMIVAPVWRYELAAAQLKTQPVAASGHNHAIVLLSWEDGIIRYLDPLHADHVQVVTDTAFWEWQDGNYWWVDE